MSKQNISCENCEKDLTLLESIFDSDGGFYCSKDCVKECSNNSDDIRNWRKRF